MLVAAEPADLPEIAGYYSQLAGVLAGFSFAALVAVATLRPDTGAPTAFQRSLAPLTSAFAALIASSLNYAVMTGERAGTPRVAVLQAISGMGFSVAGIMLFYSVLVLLSDLWRDKGLVALMLLRRLTVYVLPPLLVLLMWGGVRDHLGQKYGPDVGFVAADWAAIGALATTVIACVSFRFLPSGRRGDQDDRVDSRLSGAGAGLAFFSLICSATLISLTPADAVLPDALPVGALLLGAAFSVGVAHAASERRPTVVAGDSGSPMPQEATEASGPATTIAKKQEMTELEPLNTGVLVRRSIEIFPQGYLMNISIIQGVALSVITVETVKYLKVAESGQLAPAIAQSALSLAGLIIVSYEYLWFSTILRWTPTFRDTAIPVVLGVSEIIPSLLLESGTAWWIATAVFALFGAGAFTNTNTRLTVQMFEGDGPAPHALVRRLLRVCAAICLVTAGFAVAVAALVRRLPEHAAWISTASASTVVLLSVVVMAGYSESVLNKVYAGFGIRRRPPAFKWMRDVLRRE
ncbi:hypothetical protein AB0C12_21830 [Actinoplanes sp. NPDC048967]|uniref:hypothetical protein n=1 Tax=Actinoplanes sp. NPDC048967 TaxID=3155269 RepID=UPI0033F41E16